MGLMAAPALAHDFWIEPTSFRPVAKAPVGLSLLVGEHFTGDTLPRNPQLLRRFVVVGPDGEAPVAGIAGTSPAGLLAPAKAGLYIVGYESRQTIAEMDRDTMETYIEEEGLAAQLSAAKAADFPVKDAFSRSAKTLLLVPEDKKAPTKVASAGSPKAGSPKAGTQSSKARYDHLLGLPLELVPLANPHELAGDRKLPLKLLYRGKPLSGILVSALHQDDPLHPVQGTTDDDGQVRLLLSRPGPWLIKAVRIERTQASSEADYESLWASLTFEVPN